MIETAELFGWKEEPKKEQEPKEKKIKIEFSEAEYNVLLNGFADGLRRKPKEMKELSIALSRLLYLKRVRIVRCERWNMKDTKKSSSKSSSNFPSFIRK